MKDAFVIFRYPSAGNKCVIVKQDESTLKKLLSFSELGKADGFVFAPFRITEDTPAVFFDSHIRRLTELDYDKILRVVEDNDNSCVPNEGLKPYNGKLYDRYSYEEDFNSFKAAIKEKRIDKVVLSRSQVLKDDNKKNVIRLFLKACENNPDSFIVLISSDQTGVWLVATPEVLLERCGNVFHTIALAGTMDKRLVIPNNESEAIAKVSDIDISCWSNKNIGEQQYVSSYIKKRLSNFFYDIEEIGPKTVSAGNVVHLRSDFFAEGDSITRISPGDIIGQLHPTPAVCGVPADESYCLINNKEHNDRRYYSGFCGVVETDGDSHLYVTLRCMEIFADCYKLYAGGGILAESNLEEEWRETELKMKTMMDCI